jgi:6,7-dimethyl-8-ribityllumazine synthase
VTGLAAALEASVAVTSWHKEIVDRVRLSFVAELAANGIPESRIYFFDVSGSLEIPLQAKLLARSGRYAVIVGAGLEDDTLGLRSRRQYRVFRGAPKPRSP